MRLDAVIFGGGAAGLWLLDELLRRGRSALLLEARALGSGQTVASQGILHGGLKYTLQGLWTGSAAAVREMPALWRDCLSGTGRPSLAATRLRAEFCCLWRSESLSSKLGMVGAKFGLRVMPRPLSPAERPAVLRDCSGSVFRLDEQVIAPDSFIADLSDRNREYILKIDADNGVAFRQNESGALETITITHPHSQEMLELKPRHAVFTAGAGNAELRRRVGLAADAMQRRPLQMVLLRGELPELGGHCVDGAKTRVTITSDLDGNNRRIWQVGGQIAEEGAGMPPAELIAHAKAELEAVLPGLDLSGVEWSSYRADRAEAATRGNRRPETVQILQEANILTAWPTKLVLAPKLAEELVARMDSPAEPSDFDAKQLAGWPRPEVALPPWETCEFHPFAEIVKPPRAA